MMFGVYLKGGIRGNTVLAAYSVNVGRDGGRLPAEEAVEGEPPGKELHSLGPLGRRYATEHLRAQLALLDAVEVGPEQAGVRPRLEVVDLAPNQVRYACRVHIAVLLHRLDDDGSYGGLVQGRL